VTENIAEPDDLGPLRALGQVEPPGPGVLEAAREALWSAVAGELWSAVAGEVLSADLDGETSRARTGEPPDDVRRRRGELGW
jgi:hypothetical protein